MAVRLPAQATTAAAFLRRPEVVTAISGALETLAGRRIRYGIVTVEAASEQTAAAVAEQTRPASVQTQAALLREAADHPLVAHARTLFDAAIRKVEPPRAREPRTAPAAVAVCASRGRC